MSSRLRKLLTQFSIRDLLWLMLVIAGLAAWWHAKLENAAQRADHLAKFEELQAKLRDAETASQREARLRLEVEMLTRTLQGLRTGLATKEDELRDSLRRREEVLEALRMLKETPVPAN